MATCPSGHESADDDFCDVCGFAIGPVGNPSTIPALITPPAPSAPSASSAPAAAAVPCPQCGVPRAGQFCESCGYDFAQPANGAQAPRTRIEPPAATSAPSAPVPPAPPTVPPAPVAPAPEASASAAYASGASASAAAAPAPAGTAWTAVVTADRAYYDSIQAEGGPGADGISFPVYCPQRRFRLDGAEVRVGRRSAHTGIEPEIDLTGPPADPGVSRLHAVLLRGDDGSWSVVDPGSANGTQVNGAEIARDELVPLHDGDRIHLGAWTELRIITER
jgi:hypothetical protein